MSVYPSQIIANFSMMQSFIGIGHVDGVYWTLVYEISFYFAVFALLLIGLQKHLDSIFIYWPVLFCIAIIFGIQSKPYLGGYYYYFSAGAIFAVLANNFNHRAFFSLLVTYVLCMNFSAGNADHLSDSKGVEYSAIVIGLVVTSFFFLFSYQNSKKGRSLSLPMSQIAGALTYPIYLIHAHFGYMFLSRFATEENKIFMYPLTLSIVLITALAMHLLIEKKLHSVWKRLFSWTLGRPINGLQRATRKIQLAYNNRIN